MEPGPFERNGDLASFLGSAVIRAARGISVFFRDLRATVYAPLVLLIPHYRPDFACFSAVHRCMMYSLSPPAGREFLLLVVRGSR
jgi:hypothetical protein